MTPRPTETKRDVSRALDIVNAGVTDEARGETMVAYTREQRAELRQILMDIDARSGRRDPSKRKSIKRDPRA
jgi:hypothetical protein